MDTFKKILILIGVLLYILYPADLMPGVPIDDAIVALLGVAKAAGK